MDSHKQQVAERVKEANNILVTVSNNPSVDQLAACIGLTLALNKMGKHATAVFSGEVPSILEFLQPEKTIEKNTDSLRDFIIALDKSKADKLRYKVEDRVVKIFITPYRTSLSDNDLEFSQGDFNIDVILALGVHNQSDLDQAITAHGRILHDAVIMTLNNKPGGELGSLNWLDPTASSLSELSMQLLDILDHTILDEQIATAMLTGIVAETERFSNAKTTPQTMSISAELMTAGANQQLVASKLEEPVQPPAPVAAPEVSLPQESAKPAKKPDDGTLEITHDEQQKSEEGKAGASKPGAEELKKDDEDEAASPQIHIDEHGSLSSLGAPKEDDQASSEAADTDLPKIKHHSEAPKMVLEPPTLGGPLTASGMPDAYELLPSDPLTLPSVEGHTDHLDTPAVAPTIMPLAEDDEPKRQPTTPLSMPEPVPDKKPEKPAVDMPAPDKTLSEIEHDVHSSHVAFDVPPAPAPEQSMSPFDASAPVPEDASVINAPAGAPEPGDHVQNARDAVAEAINSAPSNESLPPIQALNAQPLGAPLGGNVPAPQDIAEPTVQQPPVAPFDPSQSVVSPAPAWSSPGQPTMPQYAPDLTGGMPSAAPAMFPPSAQMPAPSMQGGPEVQQPQPTDPNAPPQVPPPFMPPSFR